MLREKIGGMIEEALNEVVDSVLTPEVIKKKLHDFVDQLPEEKLIAFRDKVKEAIDKIDGKVG